jgi:hypothetical protein
LVGAVVAWQGHESPNAVFMSGSPNDVIAEIPAPMLGSTLVSAEIFRVLEAESLKEGGLLAKVALLVGNPLGPCGVSLSKVNAKAPELPLHVRQGVETNEVDTETIKVPVHVEQGMVVGIEAVELPVHVGQCILVVQVDVAIVENPLHVVQEAAFDTPKTSPFAADITLLRHPGAAGTVEIPLWTLPLQAPHAPGTEVSPELPGIKPNNPTTSGKTALKVAQASQTKS